MALKAVVDTVEGLPADIAKEYVKGDDGKFRLGVEGMVDKTKLEEFRTNNIALQQRMEALKDIDPKKYQELLAIQRKVDEKKLIEAGDIDGLVNTRTMQMRQELESKLKAAEEGLTGANQQLQTLLIDNAVRAAATAQGVLPSAVDDVILRAKLQLKVKDGSAVVVNDKGETVYGADGVTPMTVPQWVAGLKKSAGHLFPESEGGGARRNSRGGVDTSKMSAVDKIAAGLGARQ